jgi:hypothetical protein
MPLDDRDMESFARDLRIRAPDARHTFIQHDDAHDGFGPDEAEAMDAWWATRWRTLMPGGLRMALVRETPTAMSLPDATVRVSRVSMCVLGDGGASPLSADEARSAYYHDPDTGRPVPAEPGLVFTDFDHGPAATDRSDTATNR